MNDTDELVSDLGSRLSQLKAHAWKAHARKVTEERDALRAQLAAATEQHKCSVCGKPTDMACSDCRIDLQTTVFVCAETPCLDEHEKTCPSCLRAELAKVTGEAQHYKALHAVENSNHRLIAKRLTGERDAAREALAAALKFVPEYEDWMDNHPDDRAIGSYRGGRTFGDLRSARALIAKTLGDVSAKEPKT